MVSTSSSDDLTLSFANLSVSASGDKKRGSDSTLTPNCSTSEVATDKEKVNKSTQETKADNLVFGIVSTSTAIPVIPGTSQCSIAATTSKLQSSQLELLPDQPQDPRRVSISAWSSNFENLLSDPIGRKAFKDFQSREFSAENLSFYLACRQLAEKSGSSLSSSIDQIYETYLSKHATDPINIDNDARKEIEAALKNGQRDCKVFLPAETQIFTLMKLDSYHRFLRSDIFAKCASAEQSGRPLPYDEEEDVEEEENCAAVWSPANADEGSRKSTGKQTSKRRSFIPWTRFNWSTLLVTSKAASLSSMPANKEQTGGRRPMMYKLASSITKLRSKSLDEQVHNSVRSNSATLSTLGTLGFKAGVNLEAVTGGEVVGCGPRQGHSSSVDHSTTATRGGSIDCSFDMATVFTASPETSGPSRIASLSSSTSAELSPLGSRSGSGCALPSSLLRVIYPDGSSTIVSCAVTGTEHRLDSVIRRLLLKRRIDFTDFEVFKTGESAPIDLSTSLTTLSGCEVCIEVYLKSSSLSKSKSHFYEFSCIRPFLQSPTSSAQTAPTKGDKQEKQRQKKKPERARTEENPPQQQQQQQLAQTMRRFHSASMESTPSKNAKDDGGRRRSSGQKGEGCAITHLGTSSSSFSTSSLQFTKDKQADDIGVAKLVTLSSTTTTIITPTTSSSPANTTDEASSSNSPKPFLSHSASSLPLLS